MNPSIVFGEDDMGPPGVIKQLRDINIDLRIIPEEKTIDGILDKIYCIASIIDKVPNAESKINSTLIPDILSIEKRLSTSTLIPKRVMFIFSIKGNKIIVAGSGTSGNGFIKMTGSENIFGTIEGWKSVSQEAVIKENPDYIIMSQRDLHNSETIKSISENPIFKNIKASKEGNFIFDDAMAMLGYGPRTIKSVLNATNTMYPRNE
jgi:iron complex transport system substrate-binding protein